MTLEISSALVKELRQKTGAGMMNCKKALQETNGDFEEAIKTLRQKGLAAADKKVDRKTIEGVVNSYIHAGGKIGVLVEVNCETDFVARREEFQELVQNIAMQIAASPDVLYVNTAEIPKELFLAEKEIESEKEDLINKPDEIKEKIILGRIEKTLKNLSLLDQAFIRDSNITIEELIKEKITLFGENIKIKRFTRYTLGS
uniref:Multifunctional fusion protein n=1 Tax=Undaria pinnatifida TaxID=74381 RepID=A0A0R6M8U1_UNDPI|nr:elongation factor Ts [Undaria pinnatifida]AKG49926.1 elongation factor Ts [Undaria pinnatifida]AMM05504.1 elongation factor Ts [Undaria pinnatifida]UXC97031.1 elongation factor Ts [Undaria pinnatifida]UXC97169.1 elongation factor Ts [Undaria pinnatifida]UXC97307.1 elongation factor Ts [Undaria pinnatifida]